MKELLVPAGDMNCLRQAVYHGADAVYLACKSFGARKFATNFSNEEIIEAISFCHLYGVKLYVTMNTLVKNNEVESFLGQARFLHKNGVDALIVQDFGMICLLREMFPNLEIHASTQANNSTYETCKLFYDLGVKRVVFSRELSIDEIDAIDIPIEKEAFVHGALCVSYSGCCLMSSMLGGRSGNRGECAGSCRLPYTLTKNGKTIEKEKYLLSMKELNTSSMIDRLLDSSIYSFKIEGRMKGPLYVAFITEFYRKLIDHKYIDIDEENKKLMTIFNREFTTGRIFGNDGVSLINKKSPNHIGLRIGIVKVKKDKVFIELDDGCVLHQHDSIRFLNSNKGMVVNFLYDKKGALCSSSNDICYVDNKVGLIDDDILMKTQDILLEDEYIVNNNVKKIPITYSVIAKKEKILSITISDGVNSFTVLGGEVSEALSRPTDRKTIYEKLSRIHETPFYVENINYDIDDNIFIQIKQINDIRRELITKLIDSRKVNNINFVENKVTFEKLSTKKIENGLTCYVINEEQLNECLELNFKRIYVNDIDLYNKYKKNERVYYFGGRCRSNEVMERNVVSDTFKYNDNSVGLYFLNITNIYTAYYLQKNGLLNIP